jgi:methanogenic corrinoid protein MtbC1
MGRSISSVAELPPEAAEALLSEDLEATAGGDGASRGGVEESWVEEAFAHLTSMDAPALERTLWRAFLTLGARPFLDQVAAPLLARVGTAWAAGRVSPAQEHLGSGVMERILTWMNDPSKVDVSGPTVVIATLPDEPHALGARLAAAAAAAEGWRTVYLGADLPVDQIADAAENVGAQRVAISAVKTERVGDTAAHLTKLRELLSPDVTLMVGGAAARLLSPHKLPAGVLVFENLDAFARPHRNGPEA